MKLPPDRPGSGAERRATGGDGGRGRRPRRGHDRARSHCRLVLPFIRLIPDSLKYTSNSEATMRPNPRSRAPSRAEALQAVVHAVRRTGVRVKHTAGAHRQIVHGVYYSPKQPHGAHQS